MQMALDGAFACPHHLGRLPHGESLEVNQHKGFALSPCDRVERSGNSPPKRGIARRRSSRIGRVRGIGAPPVALEPGTLAGASAGRDGEAVFRKLINRCLGELRDWTEQHPEARGTPDEVYARIRRLLWDARRIETSNELEARVRAIEDFIAREGPVSDAFLPALEELHTKVTEANL